MPWYLVVAIAPLNYRIDLPFKKGDSLEILCSSKDPNWYKARRYDGLEGMIPFNYVQEKRKTAHTPPPLPSLPPLPSSAHKQVAGPVSHQRQAVKLHSMP